MVESLFPEIQLPWYLWALAFFGAFSLGLKKSGLNGIDIFFVTILAMVYGGKASTGIIVPLLISADILAVMYYHRHTQWKYLKRLIPWMITGILIGVYFGHDLPENLFRMGMTCIVLVSAAVMVWWEWRASKKIPDNPWFAGTTGIMAGFATMVGNLAGAFSNLFFLAMRLPKNHFIGTGAWLFLIINVFKLPFHVLLWKTITYETLVIDVALLPAIVLGFFIGVKIVDRIREKRYRQLIILLTVIGAVMILFG